MTKQTVAFDIDGCLASFCEGFTAIAYKLGLTDRVWHERDRVEWDFDFNVDPVWRAIDNEPRFWYGLDTHTDDYDHDALAELSKVAHVLYVTGRGGKHLDQVSLWTRRWIVDNGFPDGPVFLVPGGSTKEEVLRPNRHQLAAVLDDKPAVLETLKSHDIYAVARAWRYNEHVDAPRAESIADFVDLALARVA